MVKPTPNDEFGSGNLWNYDSIGLYLFATGRLNKVKGDAAVAVGAFNESRGLGLVAIGY